MGKSIYRRHAARYRALAETARSEIYRSMLLNLASEWEALAESAANSSNQYTDRPLNSAASR